MQVQIFQNDISGGGFETYKVILADGQEFMNPNKNRGMNLDILKPHVGERVLLHVYHEGELMFTEEVKLLKIIDYDYGSHSPLFQHEDEQE